MLRMALLELEFPLKFNRMNKWKASLKKEKHSLETEHINNLDEFYKEWTAPD